MMPQTPIILLTRPKAAAKAFAKKLANFHADVVISPVQAIKQVPYEKPIHIGGAIFTSRNGVDVVDGRDLPAWCVGDATMQAARDKGWNALSADGDAEALLRRILADGAQPPLVHFRGEFARGNLAERLSEAGVETREIIVYRQMSKPLCDTARHHLGRKTPVIVPLFSPRSAAQLVQQGPFAAPLHVVAMSDAVAAEAVALAPARMKISSTPDATSMVAAIRQFVNAAYGIESGENSP